MHSFSKNISVNAGIDVVKDTITTNVPTVTQQTGSLAVA